MIRLIQSKGNNRSNSLETEGRITNEAEQILHLKRLLVTLKQHYEKTLHLSQAQCQSEQNRAIVLQKKLESTEVELQEIRTIHEEEICSLRNQQIVLREMLQKAQDEVVEVRKEFDQLQANHGEGLQAVLPSLRNQMTVADAETEYLRECLAQAQKKQQSIEQEFAESRQNAKIEIDFLRQSLEDLRNEDNQIETVISQTSSHQLRNELDVIKRTLLSGAQETKALEMRYVEVLNEKIGLEHHSKQLQVQIEHQSSNLSAFQSQIHEVEKEKKILEHSFQCKEEELVKSQQNLLEAQKRIQQLYELVSEKEYIQDKYEQLRDEWKQLGDRLEEETDMRLKAENYLAEIEIIARNQEIQLKDFLSQIQLLEENKQGLETDKGRLKSLLEESEMHLRLAQQHLAKKVKEAALLHEKVAEQQENLTDLLQLAEQHKSQIAQLQVSEEFHQRQEKRLQEQLQEAFKGSESQAIKWEQKYFQMYDKWQECENQIRDLKKYEEKHLQMQSLLANLGTFMGTSQQPQKKLLHSEQEVAERGGHSCALDVSTEMERGHCSLDSPIEDEKYDLFGLRPSQEKYRPDPLS